MSPDEDRYAAFYAENLWNLLPGAYRAADSEDFDRNGPLRELVNRIGAQAAVLRRAIDRLWEDQSIETCDDWLIPYLGDLLAVNLVAGLGARGQRLDVARAIYYRRRKGTVPLLEELTSDLTEWPDRVIEFFRRLARSRHGLDPDFGRPVSATPKQARSLMQAQGLLGARTGTPLGGYADVRNACGASRTHTAFDEFAHTADVRQGRCRSGWHNIPRVGVFLWRLRSFPVGPTTPVLDASCQAPSQYTFDPTGRDVPLFAAGERPSGDDWVSPAEWQLPAPIDRYLLEAERDNLYGDLPRSLAVYDPGGNLVPVGEITADPFYEKKPLKTGETDAAFFIDPQRGRLVARKHAPAGKPLVSYHYGFSSLLGAGPYDRREPGVELPPPPIPEIAVLGGGNNLATALATLPATGTITLSDFLTYIGVQDLGSVANIVIRSANGRRPVVRPSQQPAPTWQFHGAGPDSELLLEGLVLANLTLTLTGQFQRVTLRCCTLDPGNAGQPPHTFARAADGVELAPCRLTIQGEVGELTLDRCITGPVQVAVVDPGPPPRFGTVERLEATECILQALAGEKTLDLPATAVELERCTLLGGGHVRRLYASECILHEIVTVDDTQHGCVRFSAWATGSTLPRQYESVELEPQAGLFVSRAFGRPGYAQLLGIDTRITTGAADGSEMGAFAREKTAIKALGLRIKYQEFMPLGLTPVLIRVT